MNKTKTLLVDDPFRAAYLLRFGKYKKTQFKDGQRCYVIEGEMLSEEDYRYRTGYAMVNPLSLRESFYLLKELSEENDPFSSLEIEEDEEPFELLDDTEEIDLLADEEE